MKKYIAILIVCLAFLAPALIANEEVVFESILKDAIFMHAEAAFGTWWTLKFENGAIITFDKEFEVRAPEDGIWWVGKTYVVSKKSDENFLIVKLKEEPKTN